MICQKIEHDNCLCCMILTKIQFNEMQPELRKKWVYSTSVMHSTSKCYDETISCYAAPWWVLMSTLRNPGGFTVAQTGSSFQRGDM